MSHTFRWIVRMNPERLQVILWCRRMERILPGFEHAKRYSAIKGGDKG